MLYLYCFKKNTYNLNIISKLKSPTLNKKHNIIYVSHFKILILGFLILCWALTHINWA